METKFFTGRKVGVVLSMKLPWRGNHWEKIAFKAVGPSPLLFLRKKQGKEPNRLWRKV